MEVAVAAAAMERKPLTSWAVNAGAYLGGLALKGT